MLSGYREVLIRTLRQRLLVFRQRHALGSRVPGYRRERGKTPQLAVVALIQARYRHRRNLHFGQRASNGALSESG